MYENALSVQNHDYNILQWSPAYWTSLNGGLIIYIALTTKPQCVYGIFCPGGSFDLRHRWATIVIYHMVGNFWGVLLFVKSQRKPSELILWI